MPSSARSEHKIGELVAQDRLLPLACRRGLCSKAKSLIALLTKRPHSLPTDRCRAPVEHRSDVGSEHASLARDGDIERQMMALRTAASRDFFSDGVPQDGDVVKILTEHPPALT